MSLSKTLGPERRMTDRRMFCKQGSCAALSLLSLPAVAGAIGQSNALEAGIMAQKITGVVGKVISVKGTCGAGHKVGDTMKFSENGVEGKVCIHALYSMMPPVFAMLYDAKFPWLQDPDKKTHACPDAANPVVFELTRIRE
jgi:uncharacterized repeat protein (TIGR04076 family)